MAMASAGVLDSDGYPPVLRRGGRDTDGHRGILRRLRHRHRGYFRGHRLGRRRPGRGPVPGLARAGGWHVLLRLLLPGSGRDVVRRRGGEEGLAHG